MNRPGKRSGKLIMVFTLAACAFIVQLLVHCRTQPAEGLSNVPRKLTNATNARSDASLSPMLLFQLHRIVEDYATTAPDAAIGSDAPFDRTLDSAARMLSTRLSMETDPQPQRVITALNDCIFNQWGIKFNSDRRNVRYLFPHSVVTERQGSCVGMSLLYLLLGEKIGLPLYGVRAPSHMFVRFDNGNVRLNIETLRKGECMSESWYCRRYAITDTALYPLKNLTVSEVIGVVHYNIGSAFLNEKKYDRAAHHLRSAVDRMPDFPEAQGNLALALDAQGHADRALDILVALRLRHPALEKIDDNVAALQLKCGKYDDALATYTVVVRNQPCDPQAHYGRAVALYQLDRTDEAVTAIRKAIALRPDYREAREMLERIGK